MPSGAATAFQELMAARLAIIIFMIMAVLHILVALGVVPVIIVSVMWASADRSYMTSPGFHVIVSIYSLLFLFFAYMIYPRSQLGTTNTSISPSTNGNATTRTTDFILLCPWSIFGRVTIVGIHNLFSGNIYECTIMAGIHIVLAGCTFVVDVPNIYD